MSHLLVPMVARYEFGEMRSTPEGRAVLGAGPALRPSLAVAALSGPRSGWNAGVVAEVAWSEQWPAELIRSLVRSRIDWDPESAVLAIRLVAASDFDDERVQLAIRAADHVGNDHPGHPDVMEALDALRQSVDDASTHRYRVPEMRARVRAAMARHTPPELLDLSPVSIDDAWGSPARQLLEESDSNGAGLSTVLTALLASPTASKPTVGWRLGIESALMGSGERRLVRDLVSLLVETEVDAHRPFVSVGNAVVARGAVWAIGVGPVESDDVRLLERVAERCSRTNGQPYVTEAICARAAAAAVHVLAELASSSPVSAEATAALQRLWSTVDRADVLKRIGAGLGRTPAEVAARQKEAKKSKEKGRRERSNPEPVERRKLLKEVIGDDLPPRLAALGFVERSRNTFRRRWPDRTEVVSLSTADSMVQVRFGVRFHPGADGPRSVTIDDADVAVEMALQSSDPEGGTSVKPQELSSPWLEHRAAMLQEQHARRARRGEDDPIEVLFVLVERFEAHGLPALNRWSRPVVLADDLDETEVPFPHGVLLHGLDMPGSPARRATARRLRSLG